MAIATETTAVRALNPEAGVPIECNFPAYAMSDVYVYYGIDSIEATQNVDYTVALDGEFNTFAVTPTETLVAKIAALIAADPTEEDAITIRRTLDYKTDATAPAVRYTPFTSREFERTVMRFQQLEERLNRTLALAPTFVGEQPLLQLLEAEPNRLLTINEDGSGVKSGPSVTEVENAEQYATDALASKNAAAASADAAAGSAGEALEHRDAAAASAVAADTSADASAVSAGDASAHKDAAATSAGEALAHKDAAATSEANALAHKDAAAASAGAAATSEANALTHKNAANTSATNAATSEGLAAQHLAETQELAEVLEALATPVRTFDGTNYGNMTAGGGLAAAFDNVSAQTAAASAASTAAYQSNRFIGKSFTSPKRIAKVVVHGSSDLGFRNTGDACTLRLYGKVGGAAPVAYNEGTLLAILTFSEATDGNVITLTNSDPSLAVDHLTIALGISDAPATGYIAEAEIWVHDQQTLVKASETEASEGAEDTKYITAAKAKEANKAQLVKHGVNTIRPAGSTWDLEAFNTNATAVMGGNEAVDTAAFTAALASGEDAIALPHGTVKLAAGNYTIPAAMSVKGKGRHTSLLSCADTAASGNLLVLGGNNVTLEDFQLLAGNGTAASYKAGQNGIGNANDGVSYSFLRIRNVGVLGFRDNGIAIYRPFHCDVDENYLSGLGRGGCFFYGGYNSKFRRNHVRNISPGSGGSSPSINAYGFSATNNISTAGFPAPDLIEVAGNTFRDITSWEAIDLHGAKNTRISGNIIIDCQIGIFVGPSTGTNNNNAENVIVEGNLIRTAATYRRGGIIGAPSNTAGNPGKNLIIRGNSVYGHGSNAALFAALGIEEGAIDLTYVDGLIVEGNIVDQWNKYGIAANEECTRGRITDNYIGSGFSVNGGSAFTYGQNATSLALFSENATYS